MATISRLSVVLNANTAGLKKGLGKARGMLKGFTKRILNVKTALIGAFGVLGAGAIVSESLRAFGKQEQAVASWQASLKSMGRTTEGFDDSIQKLASRIQSEGIIGDEAILEGAAFLSTYGAITDEMMPRAIRAMVDLAAKTGGSTTNAAKLLGKASMGLVGALSIAGISLSDATKKSKDFGDILTEIEQQVGGTNAALGATATGGLTQFGNAVGDLKESLGEIVAVAISPFMRLFSQEMAKGTIDAQSMGEALRDWIIDTAKSLSWLVNVAEVIGAAWKLIKSAVLGTISLITNVLSGVGTDINRVFEFFGAGAVFAEKSLDGLAKRSDETFASMKKNALEGTDTMVLNVERLLGTADNDSAAEGVRKKIDDIANQAAVAEMKSRLGIAGGPNFRQAAAVAAVKDTGPSLVRDPQLVETNAKLQTMIEVFGAPRAIAG